MGDEERNVLLEHVMQLVDTVASFAGRLDNVLFLVNRSYEEERECRAKVHERIDQLSKKVNTMVGANEERKERKGILVKVAPHWAHILVTIALGALAFYVGKGVGH